MRGVALALAAPTKPTNKEFKMILIKEVSRPNPSHLGTTLESEAENETL